MDVFELRDRAVGDKTNYLRSFLTSETQARSSLSDDAALIVEFDQNATL